MIFNNLFYNIMSFFLLVFYNLFSLFVLVQAKTSNVYSAELDEIIVTGSHIPKANDKYLTNLVVFTKDDLEITGIREVGDIIHILPFNYGSEFNSDVFTQNLTSGTSNFNLRGLGLNSTLILLNGKRQTVSGAVADDGSSFVDINSLVPNNIIDRVEILQDGGSAIYGSDAIAGVVNIITRKDIEGWDLGARYDNTSSSNQDDLSLDLAYGKDHQKYSFTSSLSYLNRSWLPFPERDFTKDRGISSFGQPGSFILLEQSPIFPDLPFGEEEGKPIIDPNCLSGGTLNLLIQSSQNIGFCKFNFSPFYHLIPEEDRLLNFNSLEFKLKDYRVYIEGGFAKISLNRGTSPSFPILNLVTVPSNNPGNIFEAPVLFLGRALGNNAEENLVKHLSKTYRFSSGIFKEFEDGGTGNIKISYSKNRNIVKIKDILQKEFNDALNGFGGLGADQFFNPFGSSALVGPDDNRFNSQEVIDTFLSQAIYDYSPSLFLLEGLFNGKINLFGNINAIYALGAQYRYEKINGNHDINFNKERYLFLVGGPDFNGREDVYSFFGEFNFSPIKTLDFLLALRTEIHANDLSSTDPKILISWNPKSWIGTSFSYGTSYRAPSIFQRYSVQTSLQNITDPLNSSAVFRRVKTLGSNSLDPEESKNINTGLNLRFFSDLKIKLSYWRYNYKNLIVKESAQEIIDSNPFDNRITRRANQILSIETSYINNSKVKTSGIDIGFYYTLDLKSEINFKFSGDLTYIRNYLISNISGDELIDVSGSRNFRNFARSLPKWRSFISLSLSNPFYGGALNIRSISGYLDDQNNERISKHITYDGQIYFEGSKFFDSIGKNYKLIIGVQNILNTLPPDVRTIIGYDSKVHNPRGRVVHVSLRSSF